MAGDCELVGRRLSRDPYTERGLTARDRGRARQLHLRAHDGGGVPGRTAVRRCRHEHRLRGDAERRRTWASGLLPGLTIASRPAGPNARASDPVVAYDGAHGVWLISTLALDGRTTRLTINRSSDGSTWGDALVAAEERSAQGIAFDKNWVACDNTPASPFYGRCYLMFTHSSDHDMLAVSTRTTAG